MKGIGLAQPMPFITSYRNGEREYTCAATQMRYAKQMALCALDYPPQ